MPFQFPPLGHHRRRKTARSLKGSLKMMTAAGSEAPHLAHRTRACGLESHPPQRAPPKRKPRPAWAAPPEAARQQCPAECGGACTKKTPWARHQARDCLRLPTTRSPPARPHAAPAGPPRTRRYPPGTGGVVNSITLPERKIQQHINFSSHSPGLAQAGRNLRKRSGSARSRLLQQSPRYWLRLRLERSSQTCRAAGTPQARRERTLCSRRD